MIQIISFRYAGRMGLLKSIALGFIAGLLSIIIIESYICSALQTGLKTQLFAFLTNLLIYSSLGYGYFSFINLIVCSMRVRILMEIYETEDGLSSDEILQQYNGKEQIELRINRLVRNGQIIYKNGSYYIGKPLLLMIAKIVSVIKLIILGRRLGFEFTINKR